MKTKRAHAIAGQLNRYELDANSAITGQGKHNRLIVLHSKAERKLTVREDVTTGFAMSTAEDRKKVLNGFQRLHPPGTKPASSGPSIPYQGFMGPSVEHVYAY